MDVLTMAGLLQDAMKLAFDNDRQYSFPWVEDECGIFHVKDAGGRVHRIIVQEVL